MMRDEADDKNRQLLQYVLVVACMIPIFCGLAWAFMWAGSLVGIHPGVSLLASAAVFMVIWFKIVMR